jgi:uncharacterized ferritin-like protein (DUF455 family)
MIRQQGSPGSCGLGGAFDPAQNAARLSVFRYAETALMHTMAGWIARVPELQVKIELARQVAFAAERADALWKRVAQLLWPAERDVALHPALARLLREMDEGAVDSASLLAGLGQVVLPRLVEGYGQHAASTDPITDAPTVRLLERLKPEALTLARWAMKQAGQLTAGDGARAARAREQVRRLNACWVEAGGWHGTPPEGVPGVSLLGELRRGPQGPQASIDGIARDEHFRELAPGEAPPPEPLDTPAGRLAYLMRTLNFELFAAELMGRNLYEYAHELPWQFALDMARQCWDEARHAEIMVERIKATAVPWRPGEPGFAAYPLDNGPWHDIYPGGLFQRLVAMNRGIEALALDTHIYRANTFEGLGDSTAALTHTYIVADEAPHVGFGTRWLRYLLFHQTDPRQADLALVPFFPIMGERFAPEADSLGQEQLAAYEQAEQEAWTAIASRRAQRLEREGRADHAAAGAAELGLGPAVVGVRRRDAVNRLARRLAGFTPGEIDEAIAAAGGASLAEEQAVTRPTRHA